MGADVLDDCYLRCFDRAKVSLTRLSACGIIIEYFYMEGNYASYYVTALQCTG
jgi:hypothetical protein